jgi:hypothetical protein
LRGERRREKEPNEQTARGERTVGREDSGKRDSEKKKDGWRRQR